MYACTIKEFLSFKIYINLIVTMVMVIHITNLALDVDYIKYEPTIGAINCCGQDQD